VAQGQRPLTERCGADLAEEWTGNIRISEVSGPGSEGACRQVRKIRAEKPHPIKPEVETPKAGSAAGAGTDLQSFMQTDAASGS
jgi:hypothetical protein